MFARGSTGSPRAGDTPHPPLRVGLSPKGRGGGGGEGGLETRPYETAVGVRVAAGGSRTAPTKGCPAPPLDSGLRRSNEYGGAPSPATALVCSPVVRRAHHERGVRAGTRPAPTGRGGTAPHPPLRVGLSLKGRGGGGGEGGLETRPYGTGVGMRVAAGGSRTAPTKGCPAPPLDSGLRRSNEYGGAPSPRHGAGVFARGSTSSPRAGRAGRHKACPYGARWGRALTRRCASASPRGRGGGRGRGRVGNPPLRDGGRGCE